MELPGPRSRGGEGRPSWGTFMNLGQERKRMLPMDSRNTFFSGRTCIRPNRLGRGRLRLGYSGRPTSCRGGPPRGPPPTVWWPTLSFVLSRNGKRPRWPAAVRRGLPRHGAGWVCRSARETDDRRGLLAQSAARTGATAGLGQRSACFARGGTPAAGSRFGGRDPRWLS